MALSLFPPSCWVLAHSSPLGVPLRPGILRTSSGLLLLRGSKRVKHPGTLVTKKPTSQPTEGRESNATVHLSPHPPSNLAGASQTSEPLRTPTVRWPPGDWCSFPSSLGRNRSSVSPGLTHDGTTVRRCSRLPLRPTPVAGEVERGSGLAGRERGRGARRGGFDLVSS